MIVWYIFNSHTTFQNQTKEGMQTVIDWLNYLRLITQGKFLSIKVQYLLNVNDKHKPKNENHFINNTCLLKIITYMNISHIGISWDTKWVLHATGNQENVTFFLHFIFSLLYALSFKCIKIKVHKCSVQIEKIRRKGRKNEENLFSLG